MLPAGNERNYPVHPTVKVLLLASGMMFALLIWTISQAQTNTHERTVQDKLASVAQQQPAPRTIGRRSGARGTTSRLPSKARGTAGGGGDSLGVCSNFTYAAGNGTDVFGIFPPRGWIELNKPHVAADLIVEPCYSALGTNPPADYSEHTFQLRGPDGVVYAEETGFYLYFNFPKRIPYGAYTLTIDNARTIDPIALQVNPYQGARMTLSDPATGENRALKIGEWSEVDRNGTLRMRLYGFAPYAALEIGLYEEVAEADGDGRRDYVLVDSWLAQADAYGEYPELLAFSPQTAAGRYMLNACAVDDCDLVFSGLALEPLGPPNGIMVPPIAWEEFSVRDTGAAAATAPQPRAHNFIRCEGPCRADSRALTTAAPAGSTALHFQWQYSDIPVGAQYTRAWRLLGKGEWIRYQCQWPGPEDGVQAIRLTEPLGLHAGTWEVIVTVDGREILREAVEVAGNHTYWDPAGVYNRCG
jgi:hypothetical protein